MLELEELNESVAIAQEVLNDWKGFVPSLKTGIPSCASFVYVVQSIMFCRTHSMYFNNINDISKHCASFMSCFMKGKLCMYVGLPSSCLLWKQLYHCSSAMNGGTLFQLRNLINRRNVVHNLDKAVAQCEEFFGLVVKAHILSATMTRLLD